MRQDFSPVAQDGVGRERNNILLPCIFFNRGKGFEDGEAVGGVFFVCLLSIIGFKKPIGDALRNLRILFIYHS